MPAPPFGTASAYADSFPSPPPRQVTISAETCFNLSLFRDMVKQYRRLDDQIITRLNRASAQLRDQSRLSHPGPSSWTRGSSAREETSEGAEGMCFRMWGEMMAGWAHRQTLLSFCLQTLESSLDSKRPQGTSPSDERLAASPSNVSPNGRKERGWKEEEVLTNQLANEESVEAIIRKRTLDAFRSRCPFFTPHPNDSVGRGWWDLADNLVLSHVLVYPIMSRIAKGATAARVSQTYYEINDVCHAGYSYYTIRS
ncbi:MAG: hypothetical protein TREMPRED_003269 [Tremellales sp. Tagirdzhanova-0007]|nr:MAG: hypothetical protein TREMPRED_003269 [Tremellales sp. Tagirdzhanova-0007]